MYASSWIGCAQCNKVLLQTDQRAGCSLSLDLHELTCTFRSVLQTFRSVLQTCSRAQVLSLSAAWVLILKLFVSFGRTSFADDKSWCHGIHMHIPILITFLAYVGGHCWINGSHGACRGRASLAELCQACVSRHLRMSTISATTLQHTQKAYGNLLLMPWL